MTGRNGRPKVGILSDKVLQRHRLQSAAGKFGLDVSFSGDPERLLGYPDFPEADLWLVTLADEVDHPALFDHLLEQAQGTPDECSEDDHSDERVVPGEFDQRHGVVLVSSE